MCRAFSRHKILSQYGSSGINSLWIDLPITTSGFELLLYLEEQTLKQCSVKGNERNKTISFYVKLKLLNYILPKMTVVVVALLTWRCWIRLTTMFLFLLNFWVTAITEIRSLDIVKIAVWIYNFRLLIITSLVAAFTISLWNMIPWHTSFICFWIILWTQNCFCIGSMAFFRF